MTLRRNHSMSCFLANLLTSVGRLPRVDRAADQRDGARRRRVGVGVHQRRAGQHGHRRLAHREHVGLRAEVLAELPDVVDVVVQVEAGGRGRHVLGVAPVGHVDVVVRQERLDRAAQQGGEMPRHGRHDQQGGVVRTVRGAAEMQQVAPRQRERDVLRDRHRLAVDRGGIEAEGGLHEGPRGVLEAVERGGRHPAERVLPQRVVHHGQGARDHRAHRLQRHTLHVVELVKHHGVVTGS